MDYRSKALLVVALTIFVDSFIGGIVVPVLPLYSRTLGLSSFQVGMIFSAYSAALLFLSIPLGIVSDRFGRKRIMVVGMIGLVLTTIAFTFAKSFPSLLFIRLLQGIAASATWMVGPALVADMYPPRERGGKMGLAMAGNGFGFLFGPMVGGFLYDWGGYAAPFWLCAIVTLIVLVAVVLVIQEPVQVKKVAREKVSVSMIAGNRPLLLGCGVMLLGSMGFGFIDPLLPGYFTDKFAATPTTIGWLFGAMSITSLVGLPLFGRMSDIFGRVPLIALGLLTTAISFSFFTFSSTVKLTVLAMAILGITYSLTTAPIPPLLADAISQQGKQGSYGTAIGLNNTAFSLGYTTGPLLGGAVVDLWSLRVLFILYGIVLLAYLPVLLLGTRSLKAIPVLETED